MRNSGPRFRPQRLAAVSAGRLAIALIAWGVVLPTYAQSPTPEQSAWAEIQRLGSAPASQPADADQRYAERRRQIALWIEQAQAYLSHYPGGQHRSEVVRVLLNAQFELACLSGGQLAALEEVCRRFLAEARSPAEESEAAYWLMLVERQRRLQAASRPATQPGSARDADLLASYREYIDKYPNSRHAPMLTDLLFTAAADRGDHDELVRLVAQARRAFPQSIAAERLEARLRRIDAIGTPFEWQTRGLNDQPRSAQQWSGRPAVLVVWASFDPASRRCLEAAAALRKSVPGLVVVAIALDTDPAQAARAAEQAQPDGLACDGLSWAGEFARRWAIDSLPALFVIGTDGRLTRIAGPQDWQQALDALLSN